MLFHPFLLHNDSYLQNKTISPFCIKIINIKEGLCVPLPGTRTEGTCPRTPCPAARTQRPTSPTCPTTTWSRSRRTSWSEAPLQDTALPWAVSLAHASSPASTSPCQTRRPKAPPRLSGTRRLWRPPGPDFSPSRRSWWCLKHQTENVTDMRDGLFVGL